MENDAIVGIIGAGPLGIELAIALKHLKIPYLQFDKGQIAQMIYNFPSQTPFFSSSEKISLAGTPIQTQDQQKCTRENYLAYIRSLVMKHDLQVHSYEEVTAIAPLANQEGFRLTTSSSKGESFYQVRFLIMATGGTSKPRLLRIPGEDLGHVSTKLEDPHRYFQKRVLIIGGKNSAAEAALRCFHAGSEVTLCVRNGEFAEGTIKYWILPELLSLIARKHIHCFFGCEAVEILQDRVVFRQGGRDQPLVIPTDFVIKAIGFEADMSLCARLGVKFSPEQNQPLFHEETMETSVPNLFVLGTIVGGTQKRYRIFIENTHEHVRKIVNVLAARLHLDVEGHAELAWTAPKLGGTVEE